MSSPLVVFRTYGRLLDAHMAKSRLQAAGIPVFLPDEQVASIDPLVLDAIGGVRLQVREQDVALATALLEPTHDEHDDEPDDGPDAEPGCPRCDSTYWSIAWSSAQLVLAVPLLGLPLRFMRKQARCARCEHAWDPSAPGRARTGALPYRERALHPCQQGRPVFRLRRSRAAMGLFWGLAVGALVGITLGVTPASLALVSALIGWAAGRLAQRDVCSEPGCRRLIMPHHTLCAGCKGTVAGAIDSPREHFVRKAELRRG